MIREGLSGKRLEVYNSVKKTIIDNIKRISLEENYEPNTYLSRVESVIPMNFLYILTHIRDDNTTDIMDLGESVRYEGTIVLKPSHHIRISRLNTRINSYTMTWIYTQDISQYMPRTY